jgi:hypothetical protein
MRTFIARPPIWLRRHGSLALSEATRVLDKMLHHRDAERVLVWLRIRQPIAVLEAPPSRFCIRSRAGARPHFRGRTGRCATLKGAPDERIVQAGLASAARLACRRAQTSNDRLELTGPRAIASAVISIALGCRARPRLGPSASELSGLSGHRIVGPESDRRQWVRRRSCTTASRARGKLYGPNWPTTGEPIAPITI